MTPKAKAKELVDKYNFLKQIFIPSIHEQKQCALIAVKEIIDSLQIKNYSQADQYEYWSEVKYYIEKL